MLQHTLTFSQMKLERTIHSRFSPHSFPGQCLICQPLCILFLLLTYCQTPHCGLTVILYLQHTPFWLSHKPGAATGCISSRVQAAARRQWLCRGPFSIQLRPESQDSRLCRDITVLEAFSIPEKTQYWVREQAKWVGVGVGGVGGL